MADEQDNGMNIAAAGDALPATERAFAETIAAMLPGAFDEKKYDRGEIGIEDTPAADGSVETSITIVYPGSGRVACFPCKGKFAQFEAYRQDDGTNPEALLSHMARTLAEAYNEEHMLDIKYSADYDRMVENLKDKEYIIKHAYPAIVDLTEKSAESDAQYGEWLTMPLPDTINMTGRKLAYVFEVSDPSLPIVARVRQAYCKDFDEGDLKRLLESAMLNLENTILDNMAIMDSAEFGIKAAFPIELPDEITRRIIADVKQQATLPAYTVTIKNTALGVSGILLSRMAMLKIAKRLGAKHLIQIIPQHMYGLMAINADDPSKAAPAEDANDIAKRFADSNPDRTRAMIAFPLTYDVITGQIS